MHAWNNPEVSEMGSGDPSGSADHTSGLSGGSVPDNWVLDVGDAREQQQAQFLPRLSSQTLLFYGGPTGLPLTIHCLLSPTRDHCCFVEWRGPNLFSPYTGSEEVFTFLNFLFPGERVSWLNTRLSVTSQLSGETIVDLPFTILSSELYTGSLRSFQLIVNGFLTHLMSCRCQNSSFDRFVLQLAIWPWRNWLPREEALEHREEDRLDESPLEPGFFVQNIVGNF